MRRYPSPHAVSFHYYPTLSAPPLTDNGLRNLRRDLSRLGPFSLNLHNSPVTDAGIAVVAGLNGTERVITRAGGFVNEGDKVNPVVEGRGARAASR